MSVTASNGHLQCLKYLHKLVGCKWNSDIIYEAAENGHLECLLYCLDNECPIHEETLDILYEIEIDKNLITNTDLRKVLFHSRIKDELKENKSHHAGKIKDKLYSASKMISKNKNKKIKDKE